LPDVVWDLQRAVGDNLKGYRKPRGFSQESFADVFGWGRAYMGQLERGECNITLKKLESIAERVELDPIALLKQVNPDQIGPDRMVPATLAGAGPSPAPRSRIVVRRVEASADRGDQRARSGVAGVGSVAGVRLDDDHLDGVARDRCAGL
jgi:transcriptional regulator with XRE-family HTH domain